jgi:hypothetical protein
MTQPGAVVSNVRPRAGATVVLELPPIAITTAPPSPGIVELSHATLSISGTLGKLKVGPIALGSTTPGCTASARALNCTLTFAAAHGTHTLSLSTYATSAGTGAALARASEQVTVSPGLQNYPPALTWKGIAAKVTLRTIPRTLMQGHAQQVRAVAYGVDAGGALIPESNVVGPDGTLINAPITAAGPFQVNNDYCTGPGESWPLDSTCGAITYDGLESGTETFTAEPTKLPRVKRTLRIKPGPTGNAQIVINSELSFYNSAGILQFAAGATGNAPPLRTLLLSLGQPYGLSAAGDFWMGGTHYSASGSVLGQIAPVSNYTIVGGAIDRSGNVYLAEELSSDGYAEAVQVNEYAAGSYGKRLLRSIVPSYPSGENKITSIAVDGIGNLFIAASFDSDHASAIDEYAPGVAGNAPPIETIPETNVYPSQIAADSAGNLFVPSAGTSILEYPPGSQTSTTALTNSYIQAFAIDGNDNMYVAIPNFASGEIAIEEFTLGSTSPVRTIAGPATLLMCCNWSNAIAVAP